jgi:hypothetical protein
MAITGFIPPVERRIEPGGFVPVSSSTDVPLTFQAKQLMAQAVASNETRVAGELAWPNFFVVGAQKCGTTSLYAHLKRHPQVFVPALKEPDYFAALPPASGMLFPTLRCRTLDDYQAMYRGAGRFAAIGDLSPTYLWDEVSAGRIHEACPQARIIIMLRDPVVRAHSAYLMNLGRDYDRNPTFRQALEKEQTRDKSSWYTAWQYVEAGLYAAQVRRYVETFGREQVLVLLFDDLKENPRKLFAQVAAHIGVDPEGFGTADLSAAHNTYKMPRFMTAYRIAGALGLRSWLLPPPVRAWFHRFPLLFDRTKPPLDDQSRQYLQKIYDPDVAELEKLLGRTFPELRKSWV